MADLDSPFSDRVAYWANRPGLRFFAKPAAGGGGDDENDDDEDDDDEDDDEDEDDDPDKGKTPEQLAEELRNTRAALKKANDGGLKARNRRREAERKLAEAQAGKKPAGDDADIEAKLAAAKLEGSTEEKSKADERIIRSEAKALLIAKGADPEKVAKLVGLIDRADLEVDDDGVDGLDDAVDGLVSDWPELFGKSGGKRRRITGDDDKNGKRGGGKPKSATERQAEALLKG